MKYGKLSRKNIETLERLAETPESKEALTEFIEKQKEARKAYKRYVKLINEKEKTPNEIRAAFIEKAKSYVKENKGNAKILDIGNYCVAFREGDGGAGVSVVNGVNNLHISRASALAWLLEDYEAADLFKDAPQPEFKWGQVVTGAKFDYFNTKVLDDTNINYEEVK